MKRSCVTSRQGNLANCEDLSETRERRHVIRVRSVCSNKIKSSGTEKTSFSLKFWLKTTKYKLDYSIRCICK